MGQPSCFRFTKLEPNISRAGCACLILHYTSDNHTSSQRIKYGEIYCDRVYGFFFSCPLNCINKLHNQKEILTNAGIFFHSPVSPLSYSHCQLPCVPLISAFSRLSLKIHFTMAAHKQPCSRYYYTPLSSLSEEGFMAENNSLRRKRD